MKYSLVMHANGPDPKDYQVYINDSDLSKEAGEWWRVGLLQDISFIASTGRIPILITRSLGLSLVKCEAPDLSKGIVIKMADFAKMNEEKPNLSDMIVVVELNGEPLGGIQELQLTADVKGTASVRLIAIKGFADWADKLPDWVGLELKDV